MEGKGGKRGKGKEGEGGMKGKGEVLVPPTFAAWLRP